MTEFRWLDSGVDGARDFILQGPTRVVTGGIWLPDCYAADTPMLLCGHGASGDRYQAPIPHLARRMVDANAAVLSIDGPVHGLRQVGSGGREAFFEEAQREGFIDDMVGDWEAAWACVREHLHVGNGLLGYFGLSMGTIFGLPLLGFAERRADMEVVAAVIGLCGISGAGAETAGRLREEARNTSIPVTFLMQLEDELFPRQGYWDLFDALGSEDKRLHANPGLHPQVPAEEIDFAFNFLLQRLTGTVTRHIIYPFAD